MNSIHARQCPICAKCLSHTRLEILDISLNQTNYLQYPASNPKLQTSRSPQPRPTFERIRLVVLVIAILSILLGLAFALALVLVIALLRQPIRPLVKPVQRTTFKATKGTRYNSTGSIGLQSECIPAVTRERGGAGTGIRRRRSISNWSCRRS